MPFISNQKSERSKTPGVYGISLFECHGHIMMNGEDFSSAKLRHKTGVDENAVREELSRLRDAGVTYFRDGGDDLGVSLFAKNIAAEYGIQYVTPAFAIHKKGLYGGIVGRSFSDYAEYRELIKEVRRLGGSFIKLMLSGIITFREYGGLSCPSLPADDIRELVNIAHGEGFPVMVHVNGPDAVCAAAECADSIEHGYFIDSAGLSTLAESGAVWVPTLSAVEAFAGRPGFDSRIVQRTIAVQEEMLVKAAEAGVLIACGSDSGAVGVPHGTGTLTEVRLLSELGLQAAAVKGNCRVAEIFNNNL